MGLTCFPWLGPLLLSHSTLSSDNYHEAPSHPPRSVPPLFHSSANFHQVLESGSSSRLAFRSRSRSPGTFPHHFQPLSPGQQSSLQKCHHDHCQSSLSRDRESPSLKGVRKLTLGLFSLGRWWETWGEGLSGSGWVGD